MYTLLGCLGDCLFDRLYPINVKTVEPKVPKDCLQKF